MLKARFWTTSFLRGRSLEGVGGGVGGGALFARRCISSPLRGCSVRVGFELVVEAVARRRRLGARCEFRVLRFAGLWLEVCCCEGDGCRCTSASKSRVLGSVIVRWTGAADMRRGILVL